MINHVINKEVFDITCKNEEAASSARLTIQHYAIVRINEIIDEILQEYYPGNEYLHAHKIEIDLGEIDLSEFGDPEMFEKFRYLFKSQIKIADEEQAQKSAGIIRHDKRLDKELEMTKAFLVKGDLPWWSDKNQRFDLNAVVKRLMKHQPEKLHELLKECAADHAALWRLFEELTTYTREQVQKNYPQLFQDQITRQLSKEEFRFQNDINPATRYGVQNNSDSIKDPSLRSDSDLSTVFSVQNASESSKDFLKQFKKFSRTHAVLPSNMEEIFFSVN